MTNDYRGSRRHILDLVSSADAPAALTELLRDVPVEVDSSHRIRPRGYDDPGEVDIRAFCRECAPTGVNLQPLNDWWVSEDYKGPTWDLLTECSVKNRPGFLLVEAKAHESELHRDGKVNAPTASAQSQANHQKIAESLAHSQQWFRAHVDPSSSISIERHYQLANRLSAAERLASCGVPVVLLYLGFTGDTYFPTDFLRDEAHWQRVMGGYIEGSLPQSWPGTTTVHGAGSLTMLIRSLPVRGVSVRTATAENGRTIA